MSGRCICASSRRFSRLAQILPEKPFKNLIWHAQPDFVLMAGQQQPSLLFYISFPLIPLILFPLKISSPTLCFSKRCPMLNWIGQCNCLETQFCCLHVASSHFSSVSGLTLLYLPARNEIIRRVDEKLTSLLHLPVALSDGCHSNHYATEQTQWVKDGFECCSLRSQPGYDRTDRPVRAGCRTQSAESKQLHSELVRFIDFVSRLRVWRRRPFLPRRREGGYRCERDGGKNSMGQTMPLIPISCPS